MKRGEGAELNIVVHSPADAEGIQALRTQVAEVHAQAVARFLEELACPDGQKRRLIRQTEKSVGP